MISANEICKEVKNMISQENELLKEMLMEIKEHGDYSASHLHELVTLHTQRTTLEWVLGEV